MKQIALRKFELPPAEVFRSGRLDSAVENAKAALRLWRQRGAQRRYLARLSWYQLEDIGITDDQRFEEIRKPFWRA